ncbi:hypothetical protein EDD85DRAFT_983513 [Armillaria nabsnona]|nr:hypothetical protein EDD85DRAFT_983513 [Armillaria nabsnona]
MGYKRGDCTRLQGMAMPRLEIWDVIAFNIEPGFLEDGYERRYSVEPIHVLEYASDDDLPVNSQEPQGSHRSLQPALKHVHCSGIPLNWGLSSPSNLQKLCLQYQPWSGRPSMEGLRELLWNSKDTLEHLELTYVVGLYGLLPEPPLPDARLVLHHVTHLVFGYIYFREPREVLQAIDFPALRTLSIRSLQAGLRSGDVLIDMLEYIRVEELLGLRLVNIIVPRMDYMEGDVRGPAEESLPLILQLFRRLSRGHLRTLTLEDCCHCFLKFMNYGRETGSGSVNLSGLKELSLQVSTEDGSKGVVWFLRDRLELGTVNRAYAGPVLERLMLTMSANVQEQLEGLGELAKERQISFD